MSKSEQKKAVDNSATEQVAKKRPIFHDENGRFVKGNNANPKGKGGFGENPQNRNDGHWDRSASPTMATKKFLMMTREEFENWQRNTPNNQRTVAQELAIEEINLAKTARKHSDRLTAMKEIKDRTEGKARQYIEQTTVNISPLEDMELSKEELHKIVFGED